MKVSVVGLGRLGLPLAAALAHRGLRVIGVDIDPGVLAAVAVKRVPDHISEPGLQEMLVAQTLLSVTDSVPEAVGKSDITIVLVPTPSEEDGSFSLDCVLEVCWDIGCGLGTKEGYHVVVVGSTVMPGACDGPIRETLEKVSGRIVGKNLGLCYCPEFVALGDVLRGFGEPDFVLIGSSDPKAHSLVETMFGRLCLNDPPIAITSLVNAEIAKIAVNCYVTTKITFANQLAELCENIPGADVDAVTGVLGLDSRIGTKYLRGGPAFGGPCFPRDAGAMTQVAERANVNSLLMPTVEKINRWQTERLLKLLAKFQFRLGGDARVGILGLTYKPGVESREPSAGLALLERIFPICRTLAYDPLLAVPGKSAGTAQECVDGSDIIVITLPYPEFNRLQFRSGQVVIDCWRIFRDRELEECGVAYVPIGVAR